MTIPHSQGLFSKAQQVTVQSTGRCYFIIMQRGCEAESLTTTNSHTNLYRSNHTHHLQSTMPSPAWFWFGETLGRRPTAKWHKPMLWAVHFKWMSCNKSTLIKTPSEDPFWAVWILKWKKLPFDCALRWPLHVSLASHLLWMACQGHQQGGHPCWWVRGQKSQPLATQNPQSPRLWTGYKEIQGADTVIAPARTSDPKAQKVTEDEEGTI